MQLDHPDVSIIGVNGVGFESANDTITEGRDLPWLQDTAEADVWTLWDVAYRDVILLDAEGVVIGVYNLTSNDLADPSNYDTLESWLQPSP